MTRFYSNGKLLLTAEYLVLDGATALALPSKYGQTLSVESIEAKISVWESYDSDGLLWFKANFSLTDFDFQLENLSAFSAEIGKKLQLILKEARCLNNSFLADAQNYKIVTQLNFKRLWGLGSSSTLINNIAQWAQVDAYKLQFKCFGGSGYDIACAQHNQPILYHLQNQKPLVKTIDYHPGFKDQLYFVYLNKKQNSREGIVRYQSLKGTLINEVYKISNISKTLVSCNNLADFEALIIEHESIISKLIQIKPIKERLFKDYFGAVKSLGAWGGDFILTSGNFDTPNYFKQKGFETVIPYVEMIL